MCHSVLTFVSVNYRKVCLEFMFKCCSQSSHASQNEKWELWAALHLCVLLVLSG